MTESPQILVTGCAGWLGSHVLYQLLDRGHQVRGTVRDLNAEKYKFLQQLHPKAASNLELVAVDLTSDVGWQDALVGIKYVLHTASPFILDFSHEREVIEPAVKGVEHLCAAALREGTTVERIILTSSVAAVCYGHRAERYKAHNADGSFKLFTEEDWSDVQVCGGYEKSKTLAERKAWELVKEFNDKSGNTSKVELVTLQPGFIFGPLLDKVHGLGESSKQVKRVLLKTYPFAPPITSSHVDVRDVALAHILAMEAPSVKVANQRFCLRADDGNLSMKEQAIILQKHFQQYGFKISTNLPPPFLLTILRPFNRTLRLANDKLGHTTFVDNTKATEVLGIKWRSADEALKLHGLTLIKFGIIDKRNTPQSIIDSAKSY